MKWLGVAALVLLPAPALVAGEAPIDWLGRGVEAALADPNDGAAAVAEAQWAAPLLPLIAHGAGRDVVIDKLLPLLRGADGRLRMITAGLLGAISPGDRADVVIDALLPLLNTDAGSAAAG